MRPLLTETVVRCFAISDFAAEQLVSAERPVSVYLRWPERNLLALSPLVRLLWGTLIDELILPMIQQQANNASPYCSSLMKREEPPFQPLQITGQPVSDEGILCA